MARSTSGTTLGRTTVTEHTVDVSDAPYRVPLAMREVVKKEIDKMLELALG